MGRTIELTALRRDGGEVPVELSVSTFRAGQERFYTVVIRDITERAQAAEALRQREDQLRQAQKMEAIGRLAGGIAHDFNNVLTAILGYSELVAQELPEHSASRSDVEEIRKAARSAAALIRELLAFGRKQVLQPVVLDLNVVVTETENLLRRLIGEHIILELTLAPRLAFVLADRSQLEQVLLNLAVNARDAMPSGGRLQIRTSVVPASAIAVEEGAALPTGFHVLLSVTDSGQGMTDAVRARIFEPFFTTKAIGQGTGLGLATVYGIVSQSGGYVWVESSPGHGATFHVSLPVVQAAHSLVQDVLLPAEVVQDGWETVLLVEDNASVRGLAREMLTRKGYRVLEAANGEQGLQLATAHLESLSLVVTDVVMPVMGGRELVGHLLALRPDLKIIFTSGYTEDLTVRKEGAERGRAFLQKPFAPAALGKVVRQVLDGLETA